MNPITTFLATLSLAVGTSAIAQTEAPPSSQPETQTPPDMEVSSETKINVISVGDAPLQELRMAPVLGQKERMETTSTNTMNTSMNGNQMPPQEQTSTMVMESEVLEVNESGEFTVKYVTQDGTGDMAGAGGTEVVVTMDSRGIASNVEVENADPMVAEMIGNSISEMTVPLPEEAVGVGAKWEVVQNISMMGMTIDQTSNYEIVSMDDNRVELKITMTQSASEQEFAPPGAPPGMMVKVKNLDSNGDGMMIIQLDRVSPLEGAMKLAMEMAMEAQGMQIGQDMTVDSKSKSSIIE